MPKAYLKELGWRSEDWIKIEKTKDSIIMTRVDKE